MPFFVSRPFTGQEIRIRDPFPAPRRLRGQARAIDMGKVIHDQVDFSTGGGGGVEGSSWKFLRCSRWFM